MSDLPKLEGALALVLSSSELKELLSEYTEIGIDAFMKEGLARDIPVVNSFVVAVRVGTAVRNRIFMQKLLAFLGPFADIPAADRAAMVEKLENDPDYGRKVGEHLIELIDRIETHRKPRMLARVLRAYGAGEIDATMLHQLLHAVEHLPAFVIPEVRRFGESYPPNRGANPTTQLYFGIAGLAVPQSSFDALTYDPTPVAETFLHLELDRQG